MNIVPGSRAINKAQIPRFDAELKQGLVLINGSFPESQLNPGGHHFSHTGDFTGTHGLLDKLWIMGFERFVPNLYCQYER